MSRIELYSRQYDNTGESPLWSVTEQALYWLDIGNKQLFRRAARDAQAVCWSLPDHPGCVAELTPGSLAVAMGDGVQRFTLDSRTSELLSASPPRVPNTRFNDGKVDPQGRLWAGTMQNNFGPNGESIRVERYDGALYRFDPDGSAKIIQENVGIANTVAWSPTGKRFYFGDSLRRALYVYDFDGDTGDASNKRLFFEDHERGIPDGSSVDVDGCLWNARWDGGAVLRITPTGKLDRSVTLPIPRPTSCMFGGAYLEILYVTSARNGLTAAQLQEYPLSGSVFAIHGLGQGLAVPRMRHRLAIH